MFNPLYWVWRFIYRFQNSKLMLIDSVYCCKAGSGKANAAIDRIKDICVGFDEWHLVSKEAMKWDSHSALANISLQALKFTAKSNQNFIDAFKLSCCDPETQKYFLCKLLEGLDSDDYPPQLISFEDLQHYSIMEDIVVKWIIETHSSANEIETYINDSYSSENKISGKLLVRLLNFSFNLGNANCALA